MISARQAEYTQRAPVKSVGHAVTAAQVGSMQVAYDVQAQLDALKKREKTKTKSVKK